MALDRQGILSELGNVMNKLQSADCGCMGKMFSNNQNSGAGTQMGRIGSPLPTCGGCRRGHCHGHGYGGGAPCAGEPCMGRYNPLKYYTDTYNYLNHNLMQPVVNEVYNDLKTLTPANTVVNNQALGNQMGFAQGGTMQGVAAKQRGTVPPNQMQGMGNPMQGINNGIQDQMPNPQRINYQEMRGQQMVGYQMGGQPMGGQPMGGQPMSGQPMSGQPMSGQPMSGQPMEYQQMGGEQMSGRPMSGQQIMNQQSNIPQPEMMGGMGPEILKMWGKSRDPAGRGDQIAPGDVMQSQPGQDAQMNQGQYNSSIPMSMTGQQQMLNPTTQYVTQHDANHYAQMPVHNNMQQGNATSPYAQTPGQNNMHKGNTGGGGYQMTTPNPAAQQMAPSNTDYGQHTLGMRKFHEMFPGVSENLGYDPMAIALKMNPANEKNVARENMKNVMMGKGPVGGAETTAPAAAGFTQVINQQAAVPQQMINQQGVSPMQMIHQTEIPPTQMVSHHGIPQSQMPQQQVYTALTGSQSMAQQPIQQLQGQQQYQIIQQQPPAGDPNLAAAMNASSVNLQQTSPGMADPQMQQQQHITAGYIETQSAPNQQLIKEPIFPANPSRHQPPPNQQMMNRKYFTQYNTLGQPVEMVPAHLFQPPPYDPNVPQTLSPQPVTKLRNESPYNVKSTVSKTTLMGRRPVGNTPSRSQLQQVYQQYKGSHSHTKQNTRPLIQGGTYSVGRINMKENVPPHQVPVEKVGGDTVNNQMVYNEIPVKGQPMTQMGDVPASINERHGDVVPAMVPMKHTRLRNGLQDLTYTSYPASAAWSFHGNNSNPAALKYRMHSRGH